ncbi:ABC transporter permease [Paenibacillus sp. OAS669]|uniref:ABC transporter permease n=1 Tax=Paenibacillus sp. OAS669 TaxID=2663821 RepID=UPI00178A4166|nr:ABC transporter permease subunit [Paenibacillus sp. OAS669]MBE1445742.1 ABC-type spermidine/putrescine transport system permease subunit I [Paenibacillus sp. OAS669]
MNNKQHNYLGIAMVIPSFLILLLVVVIPIVLAVLESFKDDDTGAFTLSNYTFLFADSFMRRNIGFTLSITLVSMVIVIFISYLLAMYLRFNQGKIADWIRRLYFIPMFIPSVIGTYGIISMYSNHGWLARFVLLAGGDYFPKVIYSYSGIVLANLWFNIPFATMMLSSALSGIPNSIVESAKDAGAGRLQILLRFIIPLSYKTMLVAMTFVFMGIIGSFTAPFLIGPNAPQVLGVAMEQMFGVYKEIGRTSATAVFMFILCSFMGYFYIRSMIQEERR